MLRRMFIALMLVLGPALGLMPGSALAEPRLALLIGNGDYQFVGKLANPVSDVELIEQRLVSVGFEVTKITNAGYQPMRRAMVDFTERVRSAGPSATALIYYSGHGVQFHDVNYLIPTDAELRRQADVDVSAIPLNAVLAYLEDAHPAVTIVILDACRDNPLPTSSKSAVRGLARVTTGRGTYVAFAAEPGNTASDGDGSNSPFTAALARYLTVPDLTIDQIFTKVRTDVNRETDGRQIPRADSGLFEDFYFTRSTSTHVAAASIVPPAAPPPTPAPPAPSVCAGGKEPETVLQDALKTGTMEAFQEALRICPGHPQRARIEAARDRAAEAAVWRTALEQNDRAAYEKYLIYYSDGAHAADAKQAIAGLQILDEQRAWSIARLADTTDGYFAYLARYPSGPNTVSARERIAALDQPKPEPPPVVAAPSPPPVEVERFAGFDLLGGDFYSQRMADDDACADQCRRDAQCRGFTFNTQFGICMLKSDWRYAYANAHASSGIVGARAGDLPHPGAAGSELQVYRRTDLPGGDYDDVRGVFLQNCIDICRSDSRCYSFSYVTSKKWCWLKGADIGSPMTKRDVVSGIKH